MLAVIGELADGFLDVGERHVFAALRETWNQSRRPATRQFLERADVEVAIVEEFLERRHLAREESAVLADAVAAHGRGTRLDQRGERFERALFGAGQRVCAG